MRTTFHVEGLREIDKALGELTKATARGVLRRVLVKAAQPMVEDARRRVPQPGHSKGYARGHLRNSITVSTKAPVGADVGNTAFSDALRGGATRGEAVAAMRAARQSDPGTFAEVFVGPGRHPQAIFTEYGTVHQAPQPYMRPAFDAQAMTALATIRTELGGEVEATARRVEKRRAARNPRG